MRSAASIHSSAMEGQLKPIVQEKIERKKKQGIPIRTHKQVKKFAAQGNLMLQSSNKLLAATKRPSFFPSDY